jgi:DNA invertase Pin-like site-specific DNA recombinase
VTIMAAMAEMERGMISLRQKDVHQDRKDKGQRWGIDLGPKPRTDGAIRERIYSERASGASYRSIADRLNTEGIPTSAGGSQWHASTVRHVCSSVEREKRLLEE